jgi:hypothetical protein
MSNMQLFTFHSNSNPQLVLQQENQEDLLGRDRIKRYARSGLGSSLNYPAVFIGNKKLINGSLSKLVQRASGNCHIF